MTDVSGVTPNPSLIAKASLMTGRAIDKPFELPGEITATATAFSNVSHGVTSDLLHVAAGGLQALQPRPFFDKIFGAVFNRLGSAVERSYDKGVRNTTVFWAPMSDAVHGVGQALSNPFSLFYARRTGFDVPMDDPAATKEALAAITDPVPHERWPMPAPPADDTPPGDDVPPADDPGTPPTDEPAPDVPPTGEDPAPGAPVPGDEPAPGTPPDGDAPDGSAPPADDGSTGTPPADDGAAPGTPPADDGSTPGAPPADDGAAPGSPPADDGASSTPPPSGDAGEPSAPDAPASDAPAEPSEPAPADPDAGTGAPSGDEPARTPTGTSDVAVNADAAAALALLGDDVAAPSVRNFQPHPSTGIDDPPSPDAGSIGSLFPKPPKEIVDPGEPSAVRDAAGGAARIPVDKPAHEDKPIPAERPAPSRN